MIKWIKEWFETWRVLRDHPDVMKVLRDAEAEDLEVEIVEEDDVLGYYLQRAMKPGFLKFDLDLDIAAIRIMLHDWIEYLDPTPSDQVSLTVETILKALADLELGREMLKHLPVEPITFYYPKGKGTSWDKWPDPWK